MRISAARREGDRGFLVTRPRPVRCNGNFTVAALGERGIGAASTVRAMSKIVFQSLPANRLDYQVERLSARAPEKGLG